MDELEKTFREVNQEVEKVAELAHFKRHYHLRKSCDASKQGLDPVLQQWRTINGIQNHTPPDFYLIWKQKIQRMN